MFKMHDSIKGVRDVLQSAIMEHLCHLVDDRQLDQHLRYFQRILNWRRTDAGAINGSCEVVLVDGDVRIAVIVTFKRLIPTALHCFNSLCCEGRDMIM